MFFSQVVRPQLNPQFTSSAASSASSASSKEPLISFGPTEAPTVESTAAAVQCNANAKNSECNAKNSEKGGPEEDELEGITSLVLFCLLFQSSSKVMDRCIKKGNRTLTLNFRPH